MLPNGGATRNTIATSTSLGFLPRGDDAPHGAVAVTIPGQGDQLDAETSVCGLKAFLVDERRRFSLPDGSQRVVDCAKVAALDITDSPVHVHGETVETYHILSGTGRMLLGDRVVPVRPGSLMVIPPGVRHGLVSDNVETPIRVVMTFSPGLAPIDAAEVRDEQILADAASAVITALE